MKSIIILAILAALSGCVSNGFKEGKSSHDQAMDRLGCHNQMTATANIPGTSWWGSQTGGPIWKGTTGQIDAYIRQCMISKGYVFDK